MVTAIDLAASRTVSGGVGGEERAPIDDLSTVPAGLEGSGQRARLRMPRATGGGAGLAPAPMHTRRTAGRRLSRRVAAHVTPRPCAVQRKKTRV